MTLSAEFFAPNRGWSAEHDRKARELDWLLLDVDGVLTDGLLHVSAEGELFKSFLYVRQIPVPAGRAGFGGSPLRAGNALFDAFIGSPSGVVFAVSEYAESWQAVRHPGQRINLHLPELMPELGSLEAGLPRGDTQYPFVLSAGERRSDTSNTSIRDPGWHRQGPFGTLRINPADAAGLDCTDGDWARITTRRGTADAPVEISSELQPGHVSLPNGHGIDYHQADGWARGSGLGLTICHRIVQEHGGTNDVESAPGAGAAFLITLPGAGGP